MNKTLRFRASIDSGGNFTIPTEILRQLAAFSSAEICIEISSADSRLTERGISGEEISDLANTQKIPQDVAEFALLGAGNVPKDTLLFTALEELMR